MSKNEYIILRSMLVTYFTHISKAVIKALALSLLLTTSLEAQIRVSYSCFCDDSFPDGVVGFQITVFGNAPGETYTVDNVINLYESINPNIIISDGTALEADAINPDQYKLSGFSYAGIIPFVSILDGMGAVEDINMTTCMIPDGEIIGDTDVCIGMSAMLEFDLSAQNITPNSTVWNAPGAASATPSGPENLGLELEYDMPGTYLVTVSSRSSTGCEITDDILINVIDAADGMFITGPDYICLANAGSVDYSVNNPGMYPLVWTYTSSGTAEFNPAFMGDPMTGSGSSVMIDFLVPGQYTLQLSNPFNGCVIDGVNYMVNVAESIDTVQIIGETYVCEENVEVYTIANAADYSDLDWTIEPGAGSTMTPADGMADEVSLSFDMPGVYILTVSGLTPDGCPFESDLEITVPDEFIPSLACNNSVNVSLNNNCILELQADMILEGTINDNAAYEIVIEDYGTGEVLSGNMITQDQLGHVFKVTVIEKCGGNSCWGNLLVEDKSVTPLDPFCRTAPVVTTCYEFGADSENPAGFPDFPMGSSWDYNSDNDTWLVSGFDNCSDALLSYNDAVLSKDICDDPQQILRTWTAVDINNGLFTTCEVLIHVILTDKNSIIWPKDFDSTLDSDPIGAPDTDGICPSLDPCNDSPNSYLLCGDYWYNDANGNPSPECTGEPISNGFSCPNLQVIGYTDKVLDICGKSKKILRTWTVWDACDQTDIMHTQLIALMDTLAPVCEPPTETLVNSDIHECGADIYVEPPLISGECDDYSYTIRYKIKNNNGYLPPHFTNDNVSWDKDAERWVIHDVDFTTDSLWVEYIVRDVCGNRAEHCYAEFELIDDEQPVPACDLNNVVTLNQYGEAWVGPGTFDDHSWDNCGVYQRVIRRMNDACECAEPRFDFLHSLGEYNGHYYFLSKEKMHAGKAFGLAEALEAYIVRVDNAEENSWVRQQVNQFTEEAYYIGLGGVSTDKLFWQEGNSSYDNWSSLEPGLSASLKNGERVYTAVDEEGKWYAEGRNKLNLYYVMEIEEKCHWSQKVSFCCEDVGQETMVAMKVIDWHGNHNQCMVNVHVLDFLPPHIECPDDVTANCQEGFDPDDLSEFGEATAIDDCGGFTIEENIKITSLNCGEYIIRRIFTARDQGGNASSCTQHIELSNERPFTFDDIEWPADITLVDVACSLDGVKPALTGEPSWDESLFPCSNIAYTYDDLMFHIVEGACQKLVRTWSVVDWCQQGRVWEYSQVIKLNNNIAPSFDSNTCRTMVYNDADNIGNCLVQINDLVAGLNNNPLNCAESPAWSYTVDLYSDGVIDWSGNGNDASGQYPYGSHRIHWTVTDDCHNVNTCTKTIRINDNVPPTPYCLGEIVIPISHPDGVEVWASDLDLGSADDCPDNPVYFSFEENALVQLMSFDCSFFEDSLSNSANVELELWVWDNINPNLANKSLCVVQVTLQDNVGACDNTGGSLTSRVSGMVYTEDIEMVSEVNMHIESESMSNDYMSMNGQFAFDNLDMYNDYRIQASKDGNYLNGVSTLDLVLIQRHILGLDKLDSPYKIIAADIDDSHSISALDLIELRKLILGIYDELPNNESWRFVEESFKFLDPLNPFPYSENIQLDDLDHEVSKADFIAVKIGDVNNTAYSGLKSASGKSLVDGSYTFDISKELTAKGNTRVLVTATEDIDLAGLQFEWKFNSRNSELLAAIPIGIDIGQENIAWHSAREGVVRLSWNSAGSSAIRSGEVLMEFLFRGEDLNILTDNEEAYASNELYVSDVTGLTIKEIEFRQLGTTELEFEVFQNTPNPFKDETSINFILDKSGPVKISVTDQTGRLLYSDNQIFEAGENTILIDSRELNAAGLLYYQISTATHTATRKMIVIK